MGGAGNRLGGRGGRGGRGGIVGGMQILTVLDFSLATLAGLCFVLCAVVTVAVAR